MRKRKHGKSPVKLREENSKTQKFLKKNGRYFGILSALSVFVIICIGCLGISMFLTRKQEGTYVQQETPKTDTEKEFHDMEYRFYLDLSPSMGGFLWEEINSSMAVAANIFPRFNRLGQEERFYFCTDKIKSVDEEKFYAGMAGIEEFRDNYLETLLVEDPGEGDGEKIEEQIKGTIDAIDLSDIFNRRYDDGMAYREGRGDLNLIITDLNFMKEGNEDSQKELSGKFADTLAKAAERCDISIYQIFSRFAGDAIDSVRIYDTVPDDIEDSCFYMIIFSENSPEYQRFIEYMEKEFVEAGVDISRKFELLNSFSPPIESLVIDRENLLELDLIEKKNLNFDNGSFKHLMSNAMGMRLVKGQGTASLDMCVAPIAIPGYYDAEKTDHSKIEANVQVYKPIGWRQYEEDSGSRVIISKGAGLEWVEEKLYLRLRLEIDPDAVKPSFKRLLGMEFLVLDIQFFMREPAYSLPGWLEEDGPEIRDIFWGIAERKATVYKEQRLSDRYLGSMVIYIVY